MSGSGTLPAFITNEASGTKAPDIDGKFEGFPRAIRTCLEALIVLAVP